MFPLLYSVRDIGKAALAQRLNPKDKKWSFNICNQDFLDVKKLSSINGERIICMDVTKGKVIFSEKSSWELEVDEIEADYNDSHKMMRIKHSARDVSPEKNAPYAVYFYTK